MVCRSFRSLFLATAVSVLSFGNVAHAVEIPAVGDVEGLVVETLWTNYALRLTQGNFIDCQANEHGSTSCAVEGGVLRLDNGGQSRILDVTKVSHLVSRWSDDHVTVMYVFKANWQQDINGFSVNTPVILTINHSANQPEKITGYIKAGDLNVSHQVLMKRVAH